MSAPCSGMTPWESPLRVAHPGCQFYCRKPGNAIESWDRWDGKEAGKRAGSQEGSVISWLNWLALESVCWVGIFWWKIFVSVCWGTAPLLNSKHLPWFGFVTSLSLLPVLGCRARTGSFSGAAPWGLTWTSQQRAPGTLCWGPGNPPQKTEVVTAFPDYKIYSCAHSVLC